jgi:2-polyprenyl-3-methyl-5-hydroxy-6-metoxy-1,4-benzoquinol methylase
MQLAWGYALPMIVNAAVQHGIFDNLDKGAKTAQELADAAGVPQRGVRAIANALVGIDLLAKDADERYSLTPESAAFLVSGKPSFLGRFIWHTTVQIMPRWTHLAEAVEHGKPVGGVNHQEGGVEFFQQFVEDLFPLSYPSAQALAAELRVAGASSAVSVLDLAAGSGVWSIALAQASPNVSVTAVDWPGVLEVTQRMTARFGVADRYTFVAEDLGLADFGRGHHIATLGHILHSEGEARSRELIGKTFAALAPGGTIAIQEFVVDEQRAKNVMGLIFAVNMLVATDDGDTFTFEEISSWLRETGFVDVRQLDSPGPSPLILATKPA